MRSIATFLLLGFLNLGMAQNPGNSPYLSINATKAHIPLKASTTEVEISGTIAHVRITQTYQNLGNTPIEATYVFPLSIRAAVHKMQMTIGDRTIHARIFERQEAQRVYTSALKKGKRAAKLDQDRPNVFQMNVGNIMPGDEIGVALYYTEILVPIAGMYQFVAPSVVGPRFSGEGQANEESMNMPYTKKGVSDTFDFDMAVRLNAGMIIQNLESTTHDIIINYPNVKTAEIFLSEDNENPANRDFILNYSLRGNRIQAGLLLYEHEDENFFAFQMEPPNKVESAAIPAREYLFIVDVSGSMNGYPLEVSKALMRNLLCDLRPTDTFNVQLFASSSTIFSETPLEVNEQNVGAAIRFLSAGQGGGGTRLLSALKEAYRLPRKANSGARSMVVITDGYVSVEKEAFELIRNHLDQANVFTFGIGSSVNRYLIEGMARVSQSEPFIATTMSEAAALAKKFKEYIATPLLTQLKIEANGFDVYDVEPKSLPDILAARPVTVYGKYHGKPEGTLVVSGYHGKEVFRQAYKVSHGQLSTTNKALRYLWAREKIAELDDYGKLFTTDVKDSIIALGLKYNLATNHTSFVAVDEEIVNEDGRPKSIKQPLPLPQHVPNSAVGAAAEVNGKTKFSEPFKVTFPFDLPTAEKRQFTMAFTAIYAELVARCLKVHKKISIRFNGKGYIASVMKMENGEWVQDDTWTKRFAAYRHGTMEITRALTITLTK